MRASSENGMLIEAINLGLEGILKFTIEKAEFLEISLKEQFFAWIRKIIPEYPKQGIKLDYSSINDSSNGLNPTIKLENDATNESRNYSSNDNSIQNIYNMFDPNSTINHNNSMSHPSFENQHGKPFESASKYIFI